MGQCGFVNERDGPTATPVHREEENPFQALRLHKATGAVDSVWLTASSRPPASRAPPAAAHPPRTASARIASLARTVLGAPRRRRCIPTCRPPPPPDVRRGGARRARARSSRA